MDKSDKKIVSITFRVPIELKQAVQLSAALEGIPTSKECEALVKIGLEVKSKNNKKLASILDIVL